MTTKRTRSAIWVLGIAAMLAAGAGAGSQAKYKGIWEPVNYTEDLQLTDVFFVNADTGWVSGAAGTILHTKDGGASWKAQLGGDPQSPARPIHHLFFIDDTHGWALQDAGAYVYQFLRTTDGETWDKVGLPRPGMTKYAFTSETNGFALTTNSTVATNAMWRTQDAGRTWKEVPRPPAKMTIDGLARNINYTVINFHFPSPTVGYVVGANRDARQHMFVLKTEDAGEHWALKIAEGPDFETGHALGDAEVSFIDDTSGYVKVVNGLFSTTDSGETWRSLIGFGGGEFKFADPEVGWAFDGGTFSWTVDGGKRWASRKITFPAEIKAVSLPRRDRAYAVGGHGMVYRYRVVPTDEVVGKAIDAPAMPMIETALDEQVEGIEKQVADLQTKVKAAQETQAGSAAAPGDIMESCCSAEMKQLEATMDAFAVEVPAFTGKYRNLNVIPGGIRLIVDLFGEAQGLKGSLKALRQVRDYQAASAKLAELSSYAKVVATSTKTALQTKR